jgi:metal-responsive CopG/Arc/MetJ family transcriptional regulator
VSDPDRDMVMIHVRLPREMVRRIDHLKISRDERSRDAIVQEALEWAVPRAIERLGKATPPWAGQAPA